MIATANIALKVPFSEKDQAKALGARWNAESKHWYVPQGVESAPFEKWFTNSPPPAAPASVATKPVKSVAPAQDTSFDDDIDAINARLREAYELREPDAL